MSHQSMAVNTTHLYDPLQAITLFQVIPHLSKSRSELKLFPNNGLRPVNLSSSQRLLWGLRIDSRPKSSFVANFVNPELHNKAIFVSILPFRKTRFLSERLSIDSRHRKSMALSLPGVLQASGVKRQMSKINFVIIIIFLWNNYHFSDISANSKIKTRTRT